ncbi:MAG: ORF6C domain-containing protein [Candidatus Metalachnospira sp.]|nr:ORF6C domain-containing protein [Candidatus Metalachnospira sp.]
MNELIETAVQSFIDSREVAEMIGKEHSKLLRDIRTYSEQLAEAKIGLGDFFQEGQYSDANRQQRPCYLVTRKGCEFIANKLTGVKGTEFTAKYINRFHDMEQTIKTGIPENLSPELKAIIVHDLKIQNVEKKVDKVDNDLQEFKRDIPLLGIECEVITSAVRAKGVSLLGGKDSLAYHDKSVRGRVYSDIYNEIKRQFGVSSYKALKRNQSDIAVKIVEAYELPLVLKDLIEITNAGEVCQG